MRFSSRTIDVTEKLPSNQERKEALGRLELWGGNVKITYI
jgi:hypothetical protein